MVDDRGDRGDRGDRSAPGLRRGFGTSAGANVPGGPPIWRATPRHRTAITIGLLAGVGWLASVREIVGAAATHAEIMVAFAGGTVPIAALTWLALLRLSSSQRRRVEPSTHLVGTRHPTSSQRARARLRGRRTSSYDPVTALVLLPLWAVAEILAACGVRDGTALLISAAVGLVGATINALRPSKRRKAAQAIARRRLRRAARQDTADRPVP